MVWHAYLDLRADGDHERVGTLSSRAVQFPPSRPMTHSLFTYGYQHGNHSDLESFVDAGALIVDIRFSPFSRNPLWIKGALETRFGSRYLHLRELGNPNYRYPENGIALHRPEVGIPHLASLLSDQPVCLLCVCPQVYECHRLVVSRMTKEAVPGLSIWHLAPKERIGTGLVGAGRAP